MSDRLLIAGASVPMVCGALAVLFLQRVPGAPSSAHATERAPTRLPDVAIQARKPWLGVVVATNTADLAAETEARVVKVFVRTGAHVNANDPLVQFDPSESQNAIGVANAQLGQRMSEQARSQARAEAANNQLARLRSGATWLSAQELDVAATEAKMSVAELQSARAAVSVGRAQLQQQRLSAERRMLVAPFAGTVVDLDVDPGDSVVAGQMVMRILSEGREVRFAAPPGELPESEHTRVEIELVGTDISLEADVSAIRPELDPSAQLVFATVALPAELPQPARFLPGAPVQVFPAR